MGVVLEVCFFVFNVERVCLPVWRLIDNSESPGTRVVDSCGLSCWELYLGPLPELQMFLTTKPSISPASCGLLFFKRFTFKSFMGIECIAYFLSVCTCTTCVAGALRGQKRESDPLGLEL